MLAIAYESNNDDTFRTIISLPDSLMVDDKYYWVLRDAVMVARCVNDIREEKAYKHTKMKTYLMKDDNTGYTKIGKSLNPKKREYTLQSEKPTISLFMTCDKLVERELHNLFAIKHIRGEWYNLSEKDIEYIVSNYNFKHYVD